MGRRRTWPWWSSSTSGRAVLLRSAAVLTVLLAITGDIILYVVGAGDTLSFDAVFNKGCHTDVQYCNSTTVLVTSIRAPLGEIRRAT